MESKPTNKDQKEREEKPKATLIYGPPDEDAQLKRNLAMSHTERFYLMTKLFRMGKMMEKGNIKPTSD